MLQRVQSLYLAIALIMVLLLAFMPVMEVMDSANQLLVMRMSGLYRIQTGGPESPVKIWWSLPILEGAILFICLAAIFLYRKRKVQMRLCILAILLLACLTGLIFYFILVVFRNVSMVEHSFKLTLVFPVMAIILNGLSFRAIRKDEELIKSIDRVR